MSNKTKTTPPTVPAPAKNGVKTRFDAETEHHLREQARRNGFASVQDYLRDLARRDRLKHKP